jgi:type II secretory pathway pseudopilin PulG
MNKKPFTILELLAAFVVISILIGITLGIFALVRDKMNNSKTRAIIKQLDIAMQSYKIDQGYYFTDSSATGANFPNLASATQTASNISTAWWFKLNYNGAIDTNFIKCFEYQSLVGSGNIVSVAGYSYIKDAWGRPILYKQAGIFNPQMFDIASLGKDGRYGDNSSLGTEIGKGDDITNFNNN